MSIEVNTYTREERSTPQCDSLWAKTDKSWAGKFLGAWGCVQDTRRSSFNDCRPVRCQLMYMKMKVKRTEDKYTKQRDVSRHFSYFFQILEYFPLLENHNIFQNWQWMHMSSATGAQTSDASGDDLGSPAQPPPAACVELWSPHVLWDGCQSQLRTPGTMGPLKMALPIYGQITDNISTFYVLK